MEIADPFSVLILDLLLLSGCKGGKKKNFKRNFGVLHTDTCKTADVSTEKMRRGGGKKICLVLSIFYRLCFCQQHFLFSGFSPFPALVRYFSLSVGLHGQLFIVPSEVVFPWRSRNSFRPDKEGVLILYRRVHIVSYRSVFSVPIGQKVSVDFLDQFRFKIYIYGFYSNGVHEDLRGGVTV